MLETIAKNVTETEGSVLQGDFSSKGRNAQQEHSDVMSSSLCRVVVEGIMSWVLTMEKVLTIYFELSDKSYEHDFTCETP